ncbi:MAG: flagellar hook capping FlgD N-terminal domain-containing protein [Planctomycetota bacterium]
MTSIDPTSGLAASAAAPNRFNELDSEEFLGIILAELQTQDPLAPNDTSALLEQLSSVRSIESDTALADQLRTLVADNQLSSAASLVGRSIEGITEQGGYAAGRVASVRAGETEPTLLLETGQRVPIGGLIGINEEGLL